MVVVDARHHARPLVPVYIMISDVYVIILYVIIHVDVGFIIFKRFVNQSRNIIFFFLWIASKLDFVGGLVHIWL